MSTYKIEERTSMKWIHTEFERMRVLILSQGLNISENLATLLLRIGIEDPNAAQRFLYPRLAHLEDPFLLTNMDRAISRVVRAIKGKETVTVLGDYDVDGVTSTALMTHALRHFGLKPKYLTPKRMEEGYGLTKEVIDRALEKNNKPSLFIALDCGTNSLEEVKYLKDNGIDVIIIDHHQSKQVVPKEMILINPHVYDRQHVAWKHLCTVGLVFKFVHALVKTLKDEGNKEAEKMDLRELLDLVALGTIADLVPLTEENRVLVSFGLHKIQNSNRPGIQALTKVSGINQYQPIKTSDISFRMGPRINASGRLADAALPVDMLLAGDFKSCVAVAEQLNEMNRERQDIEQTVTTEAIARIDGAMMAKGHAIVLYSPGWHSGVVGIVAGKLSRMRHQPTIILTEEGEYVKGSGRSISGINLIDALAECSDLLETWGGHPMAAGLTLAPQNVEAFQLAFNNAVGKQMEGENCGPVLAIANYVKPEDLSEAFLEELELLHPFGMNNPEPVFGLLGVVLTTPPKVFSDNHFRFQVNKTTGLPLNGIAWKMADNLPPVNIPINLAVKFAYNHWNGRKIPQLELIDWTLSN